MKLSRVATTFDDVQCLDGYTGASLFRGQTDLYDDSRRDGYSVVRRILSTAPSVVMPTRRVVDIDGDKWLVGQNAKDFFKGSAIRVKYITHKATGMAESHSMASILSAAQVPISSFYAAEAWLKGSREIDESSDVTDSSMMYFANSETAIVRGLLKLGGVLYLVRNTHITSSGYMAADVDVLDTPNLETVSFTAKTYNPITATYTTTTTSAKVLRLRWQSKFNYLSMSSLSYQPGDDVVLVLKSAVTPKNGDVIPLLDGNRSVLSVVSDGDCWHLHVRRV